MVAFIEKMLVKTNVIYNCKSLKMIQLPLIPYSHDEIYDLALKGYENIPNDLQNPVTSKSIKSSLFSYPLGYMGFEVTESVYKWSASELFKKIHFTF